MIEETVTLSNQEPDRVSVMESIFDKRLCQREAAGQLGLSVLQIQRLLRRYRESGARDPVIGGRFQHSGVFSRDRGQFDTVFLRWHDDAPKVQSDNRSIWKNTSMITPFNGGALLGSGIRKYRQGQPYRPFRPTQNCQATEFG